MKAASHIVVLALVFASAARGADGLLDHLADALSFSTPDARIRAKLSGAMDLEFYALSQPSPGLLHTDGHALFNPRLTLVLDAQVGARAYLFAQSRVDRGFDPADGDGKWRLDEYAIRLTPRANGSLQLQAGKFATVVGNWVERHGSWKDPFITAPLPYENLTGIWDTFAPRSRRQLLEWAHVTSVPPVGNEAGEKVWRTPIIWGPGYTSGFAAFWKTGKIEAALELKNASLSSHPGTWDLDRNRWARPTFSGRVGYRPNEMWNLGLSASRGAYLRPSAAPTLAAGHELDDYRQTVVAHDAAFAWRHWQVWAEVYAARFEIPTIADARVYAGYVEAKYKLTARFFGALRVNRQSFAGILDDRGGRTPWGRNVTRHDLSAVFRFSPQAHFKVQYSLQRETTLQRAVRHTLASQFTLRF